MRIVAQIKELVAIRLQENFGHSTTAESLVINNTKPEFEGDYTLVLFTLAKPLKMAPEKLGEQLGEAMVRQHPEIIARFNVIKGFLNLTLTDTFWLKFVEAQSTVTSLQEHWLQ